jgi:hypothetical protein
MIMAVEKLLLSICCGAILEVILFMCALPTQPITVLQSIADFYHHVSRSNGTFRSAHLDSTEADSRRFDARNLMTADPIRANRTELAFIADARGYPSLNMKRPAALGSRPHCSIT